jgi:hypothetical protein
MPDYRLLPEPKWSEGWLGRFKYRHGIKQYKQSGEVGSVSIEKAQPRLEEIQALVDQYATRDIYNADETGLFWLRVPDTTLAHSPQTGSKQEKKRITLHVTSNADGSHKLNLWLIGHADNPRPFGRARKNITGLPIVYNHNKKAWMTAVFFLKYLAWFDAQMARRKVLLLIDGFSAHESAVKQLLEDPAIPSLINTRVEFLPANATSLYQPCDQGIIQNLKVHYRRMWLDHMIQVIERGGDPLKQTTLLHATHWAIEAWQKVSPSTIANCWRKSGLFGVVYGPDPCPKDWDEAAHAVKVAAEKLQQAGVIKEVMDVNTFIHSEDEVIIEPQEELLDHLAEVYSEVQDVIEEEEQEMPEIPIRKALAGLETFLEFEMQQDDAQFELLSRLRRRLKEVQRKETNTRRQGNLDTFLTSNVGDIVR